MVGKTGSIVGFELSLNAIAPAGALLESVRNNEFDVQLLCFLDRYYQRRSEAGCRWDAFAIGDDGRRRFVDVVEQMLIDCPGLENRRCDLDRRFGWLEWTLAQACRVDADRELSTWAIYGQDLVTPNARSTQGYPIRLLLPETCGVISIWLDDLDTNDVERVCDVSRMRDDGPYKLSQQTDDAYVREMVVKDFHRVQSFYRQVAETLEAVLVIQD